MLEICIQSEIVFPHIFKQVVSTQYFGDLNELIIIVFAKKEGILLENYFCHGASCTPNVERVVILHIIHEKLRPLIVPRSDSDIVGLVWHIEVGEAPIYHPKLLSFVVKHQILWLDIPVHDALGMTIVQSLKELIHVVSNILVIKAREKSAIVHIIDVLKHQAWRLASFITCNIIKLNDVRAAVQILQNLNFPKYFRMPNWFEDLDAHLLPVACVDSLEHLRVLAAAHLLNNSIVIK